MKAQPLLVVKLVLVYLAAETASIGRAGVPQRRLQATQPEQAPIVCTDDASGTVATQGSTCAIFFAQFAGDCSFDFSWLDPAIPVETTLAVLCPVTCGICIPLLDMPEPEPEPE
eukprot:COSAG05_NODE_4402_length_1529_cov_1.590210_1_plen_113_part_01